MIKPKLKIDVARCLMAVCAACAFSAFALDESEYPAKPADMSDAEYDSLLTNGSWIETPGSGRGLVQIVNQQKRVPVKIYDEVIRCVQREIYIHLAVVDKPGKAEITIEVVDETTNKQALVVYPDEARAVVNIAPLARDNPSKDVFESRVRKMVLRAFAFVGGATGGYEGGITDVMSSLDRLDKAEECMPGDYVLRCEYYLERAGVKKFLRTSYRTACENGTAHKPTNIWENIVWREVHETPKQGLKIKFDKKAGK